MAKTFDSNTYKLLRLTKIGKSDCQARQILHSRSMSNFAIDSVSFYDLGIPSNIIPLLPSLS